MHGCVTKTLATKKILISKTFSMFKNFFDLFLNRALTSDHHRSAKKLHQIHGPFVCVIKKCVCIALAHVTLYATTGGVVSMRKSGSCIRREHLSLPDHNTRVMNCSARKEYAFAQRCMVCDDGDRGGPSLGCSGQN